MTYKEALEYIHSVTWKGSRPGLERIKKLLDMLGNPEDSLKFVHIAGTNGKGSTSAMLDSILRCAGYKTGLFISPYIENFNERITVFGESVSDEMLAAVTEYVKPFADSMEDAPTEFELITAIGLEVFKRSGCEIVVLEVGMGGRLDSTNIIKDSLVSVITSIALDHTAFLGDTIEKIAYEKAGIIKEGGTVIYGGDSLGALDVIRKEAEKKQASLYISESARAVSASPDGLVIDCGRYKNIKIGLAGLYQLRNVATVIKTVEILREKGLSVSDEALYRGFESAVWKGRFERLSSSPDVFYDGGHNIEGVTYAASTINEYFFKNSVEVTLIFGVMADKDWQQMVDVISPYVKRVFSVVPDNPRALDSESIARCFKEKGVDASAEPSLESAISRAISSLTDGGVVVALGSLYMYKDFKDALKSVIF